MGEGIMKHALIISVLIAVVVASVVYISGARRENMLKELEERLGLSRAQLEVKSNEELEAMLSSVNGK